MSALASLAHLVRFLSSKCRFDRANMQLAESESASHGVKSGGQH